MLVARAGAADRLHGLVLGVDLAKHRVVVRHDAFGSMPGMTMTFATPDIRNVKAGSTIEADVDDSTEPWTLRSVRATGSTPLVGSRAALEPKMLRNVDPVGVGALVPNTAFIDAQGRSFRLRDLQGQSVVLAFIYTRCRDARMCPLISAKFHQLQENLRTQAVHLVEVTLDPQYDRPAELSRYGIQYGADARRWTLATGDPEAVLHFAAQFGVTAFSDERVGIIHPERTAIIDEGGIVRELIDETAWSPAEIAGEIRRFHGQASNPLQRFNLWLSTQAVAVCGNWVGGFSGFADLAVVLAIFAGFGWIFYRLARRMFAGDT